MAIKIVSSVFYTCLICYPREMLKKYKKYGIFCYFFAYFLYHRTPWKQNFNFLITFYMSYDVLHALSHFTCPTMECYFKPTLRSQAIYQNFCETSILRLHLSTMKQKFGSRWYLTSLRAWSKYTIFQLCLFHWCSLKLLDSI